MRMKRKGRLLLVLGIVFLVLAGGIAWSQVTERVSVDSAGVEGNNASSAPSTSSDGRHVAFESQADNLVAGDGNSFWDIFVHDLQTGITTRVSLHSDGTTEGDGPSFDPSISSDGRYVAFESDADNLVVSDNGLYYDVYVHDRQTGTTTRVSLHTDGTEGDRESNDPSISGDGRYVAFESFASTLVAGDMPFPFGFPDIFVRDRDADGNGTYDEVGGVSTVRVSVDSDGIAWDGPSLNPSISTNGRYVAFQSDANLVFDDTGVAPDVFVHDRDYDEDGIYDDEDGTYDPGEVSTVRVSVRSDGTEADQNSSAPSISVDGRYVAFESFATNLVAGDLNGLFDVFVHDRDADGDGIYDDEDGILDPGEVSTVRVSVRSDCTEADQASAAPSISGDGRYVAFESDADNLVADDTNNKIDIFVHDLQTGTTTRVSVDLAGVEGNDNSNAPSISADGSSVIFESDATNLVGVGNDSNGVPDIFADDLQAAAGGGGGGGSSSGGGGCFIATAADGSVVTGEK